MKLIFYSEAILDGFCNITVKQLKNESSRLFITEKPPEGYPPLSIKKFRLPPADKTLLYDIHSLDCCLDSKGNFTSSKLSEQDAVSMSNTSVIYKNDFHLTPYFRYKDQNGQHTVWLEDTYHQIKKLEILESMGLREVGILINSISAGTVINLIRTERYSV